MDNKKEKEQYHDYKAHDLFKCENLVDFMRRYSCAHEGRLGCSICDNCQDCLEYKLKRMGYCKPDEVREKTIDEVFISADYDIVVDVQNEIAKNILDELMANDVEADDCDCWLLSVPMEKVIEIFKKYKVIEIFKKYGVKIGE